MNEWARRGLLLLWLCALAGTAASASGDEGLPDRFRQWLDEVRLIMTAEERTAFLALTEDHRREAFVEAFWRARDPDPATPLNDFRDRYYARREEAKARFGTYDSDASRVWIVNGPPVDVFRTDCNLALWPLEIWYYRSSERIRHPFSLLFYRPAAGPVLRLWDPTQGYGVLQAFGPGGEPGRPDLPTPSWTLFRFQSYLQQQCLGRDEAETILAALHELKGKGRGTLAEVQSPAAPDPEWLATFAEGSTAAPASPPAAEPVSEEHLRWLDQVALLITREERRAFLALPHAHQREGFIAEFWKIRDTDPRTEANEFRQRFEARLETAVARYGSTTRDQARVYILNGDPHGTYGTDCNGKLWPLEIWSYEYSDRSRRRFQLLFYQPPPGTGPFRLWHDTDGYQVLARQPLPFDEPAARPGTGDFEDFYRLLGDPREPISWCPGEANLIIAAMRSLEYDNLMLAEVIDQPPVVDPEWLDVYRAYSTELAADAPPLSAELDIDFPARHGSRTVVRGTLLVPPEGAAADEARAFTLTGEVLRGAALHESFRYVFQLLPLADPNAPVPLGFERLLRPGDFRLVLKLEENRTGRAMRVESALTVPLLPEGTMAAPAAASAAQAATPPAPVRLLAPAMDLVSGVVRLQAEVADQRVSDVVFSLDGKPLLSRNRPPWTVELRLGELPRSVRVRAVARDAQGVALGADELLLNGAPHRFSVRLLEPREGIVTAPVRVRAEVRPPAEHAVDRLELFLDETPLATLYQAPWELLVPRLPEPAPLYLRAVAYLADGTTAEDAVLLAGGGAERGSVEVDLVEVYAAAVDGTGRPVHGLAQADFEVREDGRPQQLRRFQHVTELPLHLALLVDTSASMAEMLPEVEEAAVEFFRSTLEPGDRAAVLTFSEEPRLAAPFDDDLTRLTTALVGLRAERGTALWDSLVYALHYFQGVPGRRALLVFSDGADRGSRFRFDEALAYAQHAGVAIYAVSFGNAGSGMLEGRRRLARLAEATGGKAFTLSSVDELDATYDGIEEDLRSQYLLVYQSDGEGPGFRSVEVKVKRPGTTARAMSGYIP